MTTTWEGEMRRKHLQGASADSLLAKDKRMVDNIYSAFTRDGLVYLEGKEKGTRSVDMRRILELDRDHTKEMRDNFSTTHPHATERVVSRLAMEALEPVSSLRGQVYKIRPIDPGRIIVDMHVGQCHAGDIAEGAEYPERELELEGDTGTALGKTGAAVKISDEALRYSQWDLFKVAYQRLGEAIARHIEVKIADSLDSTNGSTTVLDNMDTDFRSSTGRNSAGVYNGTLTLMDLLECYTDAIANGFTPNVMIMHPAAFRIFLNEPIARAFGFYNGGTLWTLPKGDPAGSSWRPQNVLTRRAPDTLTNVSSLVVAPPMFPTLQKIVLSAHIPFSAVTNLTTIYLCNSNESGVVLQDERGIESEEWRDSARDINKAKLRLFNSVQPLNEGAAVAALRNIKLVKGHEWTTNQMYIMPSGLFGGTGGFSADSSFVGVPGDI